MMKKLDFSERIGKNTTFPSQKVKAIKQNRSYTQDILGVLMNEKSGRRKLNTIQSRLVSECKDCFKEKKEKATALQQN